jgi:Rod binding domain-containing protein
MREITMAAAGREAIPSCANTPQPRLVHAAHEFEAQMLKEILQPMTGKDALTGEDEQSGDAGTNRALGEFASEALGRALSQGGGFGIAERIVHDLSHSGSSCQAGKVTEIQHNDTVISAAKSLK